MNLENLKNGDKLKIKNENYEVLYSQEEADIVEPPKWLEKTKTEDVIKN